MNSELKIYKIDLKEASKEVQMIINTIRFEGGEIQELQTEIWNDYLIVCISVVYKD
jgi:hypothetical protein